MNQYETVYLKQISDDISFIKKKILELEEDVHEISADLHEVRPEYIEKLKRIEKEPSKRYKNLEEFEKSLKKD